MKRISVIALLALLLSPSLAPAENGVTTATQVRHRFEGPNKDFDSDTNLETFNLLRTRVTLKFDPGEGVTALVQLQDSRTFGEETSTLEDASADQFDLHQGAILVNGLFGAPLDVKLGRVEAVYGPERLIGAVGWSNTGRSLDGVVVRHPREDLWLDVFSFVLDEGMTAGDIGDEYFSGAWFAWSPDSDHSVQPFWIWERAIPRNDLDRHTLGFYARRKGPMVHGEAEAAFQTGRIGAGAGWRDVSAFMGALNVGVTFADVSGTPTASAGLDYLSGDDGSDPGEYKVFDTLLATNHKYYGFMDYFLNIPVHTMGLGLLDAHLRLSAKPGEKMVTKLAVHVFRSTEEATLAGGSTSNAFGTEVDVTAKHGYTEKLSFQLGASIFVPGDIFEQTRGEDTSSWFYVMTTLTT